MLLHNLILLYQKILSKILHTILFWKFRTNKSFNKSHLIIHQGLTLKTSWIFTKNLLQNHIFWWMILLLHQIDLYVFRKQLMIRLEMKNYNTILTSALSRDCGYTVHCNNPRLWILWDTSSKQGYYEQNHNAIHRLYCITG